MAKEVIITYADAMKLVEEKYIKEKFLYSNNFGKTLINKSKKNENKK